MCGLVGPPSFLCFDMITGVFLITTIRKDSVLCVIPSMPFSLLASNIDLQVRCNHLHPAGVGELLPDRSRNTENRYPVSLLEIPLWSSMKFRAWDLFFYRLYNISSCLFRFHLDPNLCSSHCVAGKVKLQGSNLIFLCERNKIFGIIYTSGTPA